MNAHRSYLFHRGNWAKIVEKPELVLGEEVVIIKDNRIHAVDGNVTIEEWLTWFKIIDLFFKYTPPQKPPPPSPPPPRPQGEK